MQRILFPLLLVAACGLAAAPSSAQRERADSDGAFDALDAAARAPSIRVLRGRAMLAVGQEVATLTRVSAPRRAPGLAFVDLGSRSRLAVRWNGVASAALHGRASIAVDSSADAPLDPRLSFDFLESAELELRRGSLTVDLPHGWTLRMGRSAISIREAADGRIELVHRGGEPLELVAAPPGTDAEAVPERVLSGQVLRLPPARRHARR